MRLHCGVEPSLHARFRGDWLSSFDGIGVTDRQTDRQTDRSDFYRYREDRDTFRCNLSLVKTRHRFGVEEEEDSLSIT